MNYYISYGDLQKYFTEHYKKTGNKIQYLELIFQLKQRNLLSETPPPHHIPSQRMIDDMDDESMNHFIDNIVLTFDINKYLIGKATYVEEADIIPVQRDVFIIRHPRYTRLMLHIHNYYEINHVANGQCTLSFENSSRVLKEGELIIITPGSLHDLSVDDDSTTVICIMIRKSTFNHSFYRLLSDDNLLSHFFFTTLSENNLANYLLFFCHKNNWIRQIIYNAMLECYKEDAYSNISCINWLNHMFIHLLRNYSETLQYYDYNIDSDISFILQYIQYNYKTLTLSGLASIFHYSEPYLSTLIKKYTGQNFSQLIKKLRMKESIEYLLNSNMSIGEIAEETGYNSSDHFSRVFRSYYGMSPQKYRNKHLNKEDRFKPFHME